MPDDFQPAPTETTVTEGGHWRRRMGELLRGVFAVLLDQPEGMRAAVLAGLGLGIASEWMFAPELARGEVVVALPEWQLPTLELWTLLPAGRELSAKARAFLTFVAGLPGVKQGPEHAGVE